LDSVSAILLPSGDHAAPVFIPTYPDSFLGRPPPDGAT
jgi:hypothetical protein